ncbi:MAG: DEAD/DEAH box helicase [Rhodomicrobium sp.]
MFVEYGGEHTAETRAIFQHYADAAPSEVGAAFNKLLLRFDILSADFCCARLRIAVLPESEAHFGAACEASIAFLSGDNDTALAGFRDALKRFRKAIGRRKTALESEAGLFHMLALLRAGDSALHTELRGLIDAATADVTSYFLAHRGMDALLDLAEGRHDKARETVKRLLGHSPGAPAAAAIVALATLFADIALAREYASQNEARYKHFAQSMPMLARIYAEILSKTARDGETWRERAAALGGKDLIAFTGIVPFKQPWERAFDTLAAFLTPGEPKRLVEKAPAKSKRLAWFVDLTNCEVTVAEQSPKGASWTGGRPIALRRLYQRDAKLDYLTDHDQRMCRCVRKEQSWYGDGEFYFDPYSTLPALAGHPNVYNAANPSERIELIAYPVELVVKETAKGYNFNLSHRAGEPKVFLEMETPTRWRVVELSKKLLELQATLSEHGLIVPHDMRDRVASLLGEANPTVPIRSELADIDVPATPGDATPVVQLQRHGDGLKIRLGMRPFGAGGPFYLAGQGGSSVLVTANGRRQRVNRNLDAEKAALQSLIHACPAMLSWGINGNECDIEALEDVLEFLEQAQAYRGPVNFEWPEGEALRVSRTVGAQGLSIKLKQQRDWFEVSGKIAVDEELVLDMREILSGLDRARGRFVPLEGGRFVALTADLLKQLRRLEGVSEETAGGRKLHGLASIAVDDLVESVGKVQADKHWRELSARIRAAASHTPQVPATLQAELRDYQVEGFTWMSRLANLQMGACLADDMGLGKTVQTIAVMLEQQARGACLVVAPTSVCHNWECELSRFAPSLNVHRLAGAPDRAALIGAMGPGDVLIASYGLLYQEDEALMGRPWHMLVLDEAQNLKNADTKRAKASQKLDAKFRVALSGTPIENYLDELWSLFNTINPGLLGSRDGFQRRFAGPIERDRKSPAREALRTLIRPFILRRTKSAVLTELPPRTEQTIRMQLPEEERAFYEAMRRKAMDNITALDGAPGQRKIHILAEIGKLRRLCCHPALIDPKTPLESAKLAAFLVLTDELLRNRHKALVFSQFLGHLDKVREALDARAVRYQYIDGSVPERERGERVAAFQAGEGDLFLISLKAGGTGLNLTAADYVIHLDPWWNPAVEDQASGRAHRIGQSRPVTVYRLIVEDSIEERILELHGDKRDLAEGLLEGTETSAKLSEDDLLALIRR